MDYLYLIIIKIIIKIIINIIIKIIIIIILIIIIINKIKIKIINMKWILKYNINNKCIIYFKNLYTKNWLLILTYILIIIELRILCR